MGQTYQGQVGLLKGTRPFCSPPKRWAKHLPRQTSQPRQFGNGPGWMWSFHRPMSTLKFLLISGSFAGSTISTLLHDRINPKDCQVLSLGDTGFLQFFRVVSRDYGKPRILDDLRALLRPHEKSWPKEFVIQHTCYWSIHAEAPLDTKDIQGHLKRVRRLSHGGRGVSSEVRWLVLRAVKIWSHWPRWNLLDVTFLFAEKNQDQEEAIFDRCGYVFLGTKKNSPKKISVVRRLGKSVFLNFVLQ